MAMAGSSRPASGAEHMIAHFWEMAHLFEGRTPHPHGIYVAAAVSAVIGLYRMIMSEKPDFSGAAKRAAAFSFDDYKRDIEREYKQAAGRIISDEAMSRRFFPEAVAVRLSIYEQKWPEAVGLIEQALPPPGEIEDELIQAGCPVSPAEIGINRELYISGIKHALSLRGRFTVLQVAYDLGLLGGYAEALADKIYKPGA